MRKLGFAKSLGPILFILVSLGFLLAFTEEGKEPLPELGLSPQDRQAFGQTFGKAEAFLWDEVYDSAQFYLDASLPYYQKGNDSLRWLVDAVSDHLKGNAWSGQEKYDSAVVYFQKAEEQYRRLQRWERLTYAQLDQALVGYFSLDHSLMESALDRASHSVMRLPVDHSFREAIPGLKSVLYNAVGDYDQAIEVALDGVERLLAQKKVDSAKLTTSYSNLGVYYDNKGDLDRAIEYYLASIQLDRESGGNTQTQYGNLSVTFSGKGQYDLALAYNLKHLQELRRFANEEESPGEFRRAYSNRGGFFLRTAHYDSAEVYLFQALALDQKADRSDPLIYNNLGVLYRKTGRYKDAIDFNRKALDTFTERYGPHHPRVALGWRNQAQVYDLQMRYEEAISSYHQALLSLVPSFTDSNVLAVPSLDEFISPVDLLKTLRDKAMAMQAYSKETDDINMLRGALNTFQRAIDLVDTLRNEYQEGSQQFWNEEIRPLFESSIDIAYTLYQSEGSPIYLDQAFLFFEKSKASLLAAAIQESSARSQAGIPDSLLEEEKRIKLDIAFYKEQTFREQQKGEKANEYKILLWRRKILERSLEQEVLMAKLEADFPSYFQMKYNRKVVTAEAVRKVLPEDGALLEYFVGEKKTYVFLISQTEVNLLELDHNRIQHELLPAFIDQLRDRRRVIEKGLSPEVFQEYGELAHGLYKELVEPVLGSPDKSLIVIPDGALGYLPFELLLTQPVSGPIEVDYTALSYVLSESRVRYEYSATLLSFPLKGRRPPASMIGFAPTYGEGVLAQARDAELFCEDPGTVNFGNLSNNQEEVSSISQLLGGSSFMAESASELIFKAEAGRHGILHLAMHGFVNQCNPLYSGLVFSKEGPGGRDSTRAPKMRAGIQPFQAERSPEASTNDGFLHAYEIYNMQLNADLVVLSACNTGVGRLVEGEGIMSLARAFKYAGCPNIVTSLWQADDASTAWIMEAFYQNLKEGKKKDEALRLAKLEYVQSSRRNHPFFWGTFILIGNDLPIPQKASLFNPRLWLGLLALVISGAGLIGWMRRVRVS